VKNIKHEIESDGLATVTLDVPGRSVNVLTAEVFADLTEVLNLLETSSPRPSGVVFASAKKTAFVAGADIFGMMVMDRVQLTDFLALGQRVFDRIARLPMPTVSAIDGHCLGGGLELALACRYRVAAARGSIDIGLPETKIGLTPGFGGTVRLCRLIGVRQALQVMATGDPLTPQQALRWGIVDEIVSEGDLIEAARRMFQTEPPRRPLVRIDRWITRVPLLLDVACMKARRAIQRTTSDNYPAPLKLVDVVRTGLKHGPEAGYRAERETLADLAESNTGKNLLRLFSLRQQSRRWIRKEVSEKPGRLERAAVIGAGTVGGRIACALARAGTKVRLIDQDAPALKIALDRIADELDDERSKERINKKEQEAILGRIVDGVSWNCLDECDLIVESVDEDLDRKREIFKKLGGAANPDAVLATATSSLDVTSIAGATWRPERVVGLHPISPDGRMEFVEVIRTAHSDGRALATALAAAQLIGNTTLLVRNAPGSPTYFLLAAYVRESAILDAAGVPKERIDGTMRRWGMSRGPFEFADLIGMDVSADMAESAFLPEAHRRGLLEAIADEEISCRLILPIVNEAADLLARGAFESRDAVDLTSVQGLGFPSFRGGIFQFCESTGLTTIVKKMEDLATLHGERLAPNEALRRLDD
jgi:3-hydroxyacyl-CoA dehydrogenase/enoyl-CoA hydratase/3-hydroxybutyryl-CoA epimerase